MRRLAVTFAVLAATLMGPAALAENNPCRGGDCHGEQGNCRDTQAPCSDDDLNGNRVIVCLPESNCEFHGGEQPASFFPPTPAKVLEGISASFKLGVDFGRALADTILTFIENLAVLMV